MPVIKEWKCPDHGFFESPYPSCITCGRTDIQRVFLTPPGFKSDKTKFVDKNLDGLARETGMTNYSNNLSTKHEKDYSDLWKPLPVQGSGADRHIDFSGELSRVVGGGVTLAADETRVALQDANRVAAGHYEPIYHPEDKKKEPVPA